MFPLNIRESTLRPKKRTPKPYSPTDTDEQEARVVFESILDLKSVRSNIRDGDKNPNDDGYVELKENNVPCGRLLAQLKKIPSGATKISCNGAYVAFSEQASLPFILVCVDTALKKVYWRHITSELQIKPNKNSVTLHFSSSDEINNGGEYLKKWKALVADYRERVRNYHPVKKQLEAITQVSESALFSGTFSTTEEIELVKSKYWNEIQAAKTLLDSDKQETAQKMYLELLKKLKKDKKAPLIVRYKVHNNLGSCYMTLGDDASAAKYFKMAFKMVKAKSELAYRNRALASLLEKKATEGLPYIESALKINPHSTDNINIKAALLKALGRFDEALALYFEKETP